ncbi:MAG: 30S ribosomal protein S20 [Bacteroidetes bacterium]|jgi:small subunit ribosomal protein S20|nr:30S ribosomal protein S20 [Bacteroidota bacterium]MBT5530166.1 30S ribosomal protein S20 [Cytophagia bacterium]MBT3799675.1 30S ribosomal protein S20 [Bacteroidota bacterium]MBT3934821.1 30S ribosomal protein S20 [Bacteroidota bacterium]MBT4338392.1 30S ribosomal protein S20 [Bacteroidota bacterium]
MAHHKSAIKRIRQNEVRRLRNRYQFKTVRNAIRNFKAIKDKEEAVKEYDRLSSMIDKLAKRGVIHQNNAANRKAGLANFIAHLS